MYRFAFFLVLFASMGIGQAVASASTDQPQLFADDAFIDKVAPATPAVMATDETDEFVLGVHTQISGVVTRPVLMRTGLFSHGWEVGAIRSDIGSDSI